MEGKQRISEELSPWSSLAPREEAPKRGRLEGKKGKGPISLYYSRKRGGVTYTEVNPKGRPKEGKRRQMRQKKNNR